MTRVDADQAADRIARGLQQRMEVPAFLRREVEAFVRGAVREAVAWEREQCARVVERTADEYRWAIPGTDGEQVARALADAIRRRR